MSVEKPLRRRILLPLLREYYLFDYYKHLACRLQGDGFDVRVVTFDSKIEDEYRKLHPGLKVEQGPRLIRYLNNRSGNPLVRILLWLAAWGWALQLRSSVDMVVVPFDQKPVWYAMTRVLTSITCHTTTDMIDVSVSAHHYSISDDFAAQPVHRFMEIVDSIFGRRILFRMAGYVIAYDPARLLVDRMMGFRAPSNFHGVSGADYVTVSGHRIAENFQAQGVGLPGGETRLLVTGSPAYEALYRIARDLDAEQRRKFCTEYGIPADRPMYSLFLSPSKFDENQIEEIAEVIRLIRGHDPRAFIMLKFHPKTRNGEPERFRTRMRLGPEDMLTITEFGGDELNTRLTLVSHCLVQKQSTVGFIAMLLSIPIISYNFRDTGYADDLYRSLQASFHAESPTAFSDALRLLGTAEGRARLAEMQEAACRNFCIRAPSPCSLVADAIKAHFSGTVESTR